MAAGRLEVRLGPELQAAFEAFQNETGASTASAALRALIQLGLDRSGQLDAVWRRAAWREGVINGTAAFKAALYKAAEVALADGDSGWVK